jgi:hypothetical protein
MGIDPMNNISIIIRILFAVTIFQHKRELTTSYNPQQNGVAERKNRSILEALKTMIHDQDLPMCLWAEATMTIVYVQN